MFERDLQFVTKEVEFMKLLFLMRALQNLWKQTIPQIDINLRSLQRRYDPLVSSIAPCHSYVLVFYLAHVYRAKDFDSYFCELDIEQVTQACFRGSD